MKKTAENLLPPPVRKGDTIGIVAPAGPVHDQESFNAGIALLESLGFAIRTDIGGNGNFDYLSATDEQRALAFRQLWHNQEIKAIIAARGGFGSLRMLPALDLAGLRNTPKRLLGFSDITGLLTGLLAGANLIGFHGPMVATLSKSDPASLASFHAALTEDFPPPLQISALDVIRAGNADGCLLGGNLTTLVHLIGTRFELCWRGAILFLEDVGESPYRVDRMLTHLKEAGRLDGLAGLILGSFDQCGDYDSIIQRLADLLQGQTLPIWANFPAGHGASNLTIPIGIQARMDSKNRRLSFFKP